MTLDALRQARDAAREELIQVDFEPRYSGRDLTRATADLDALLRLHAQVVTLENVEKLEESASTSLWMKRNAEKGYREAIADLRATVEGA